MPAIGIGSIMSQCAMWSEVVTVLARKMPRLSAGQARWVEVTPPQNGRIQRMQTADPNRGHDHGHNQK